MKRIRRFVGLGLVALTISVAGTIRTRGVSTPSPEEFRVEFSIPAAHGSLVGTGVVANSLMLVFEDEQGEIRIYDYLKSDRILRPAIHILRR